MTSQGFGMHSPQLALVSSEVIPHCDTHSPGLVYVLRACIRPLAVVVHRAAAEQRPEAERPQCEPPARLHRADGGRLPAAGQQLRQRNHLKLGEGGA
eukprot:1196233-Prorocentrum_minimum.AAC.2